MTDITDDGIVLHLEEVGASEDVLAAGGDDENVGSGAGFFHGGHLVSFHAGLQGVDGIDLGDNDTRAEAFQRLGASLSNIAITGDNGDLSSQHDIGGTLDSINKRLPASVQVVRCLQTRNTEASILVTKWTQQVNLSYQDP